MSSVLKEKVGRYTIKIYNNDEPFNPREDDNLGTMVCFHPRFNLGDKHNYRYRGRQDLEETIKRNENVGVILPLYLYEHSGITMNTTGFSCRWDTMFVGFIYITKEKMLEEFGGKRVGKHLRKRITEYLIGEVKVYDQYLTGDSFGFKIFKKKKEVDESWGYFGIDNCMTEAKSVVEGLIKYNNKTVDV